MTVTTSSAISTPTRSSIWRAGGIALVLAVVINELLRLASVALLGIDPGFLPLTTIGPVIMFTALGVIGATVVYWLLTRFSKNPDRLFSIIAWTLLVLSFVPNILTGLNPSSAPFPGVTWAAIAVLMLMHVPPALASIFFLTRR